MRNDLNSREFLQQLAKMKAEDPDLFMDMVLEALRSDENYAFNDESPVENKVSALSTMIRRYEALERYEDCAFLNSIKKRLV
jgi:hypothetical protein